MYYLLLALLVVGGSALRFDEWAVRHGKEYATEEARQKARDTFQRNVDFVAVKNAEGHASSFSVDGPFADMTPSEFSSTVLMSPREHPSMLEVQPEKVLRDLSLNDIPSEVDWRTHQPPIITPILDQGSAGTCWAFSTASAIESQVALAKNTTAVQLSVEQIVDCDGTENIPSGDADCGVFGGWPYLAYQYVMRAGGLMSYAEYPYCVGSLKGVPACYPCPAPGYNKTLCGPPTPYCNATEWPCRQDRSKMIASISDWRAIVGDETVLAAAVATHGPLSVLINASELQFHHKGIWDPKWCSNATDHAIVLVGYGVDDSTPYWLLRNSWGEKWGDMGGYFKMIRGAGKCGITTGVTYPIP